MVTELTSYHLIHRIPHLADSAIIQEVAHVDTGTVDKHFMEILIVHQPAEQPCALAAVGSPVVVFVVIGIIEPVDNLVVDVVAIESHGVVAVLGHEAPAPALCPRAPHHPVVTRSIKVVEVEVHQHKVSVLRTVYQLIVFRHCVTLALAECHQLIVIIPVASLQFLPVLHHVDILQLLVVRPDIVLIAAFTDIEDTFVLSVDIDNNGLPGLPVQVTVTGHRALYDGIAHIQIIEVVARVSEHNRLKL